MRKHQGMTFVGMLFTAAVVIILGVLIMRVVPVYLEHYSVKNSIEALNQLPASDMSDPGTAVGLLRDKLVNQLYVNGVELPPENIRITPGGENNYKVNVKYQVIKHLVGNMSLLFQFDETKEVKFGDN